MLSALKMPRKAFISDLKEVLAGHVPSGILHVEKGDDDGEIRIWASVKTFNDPVELIASIPDVSEYPSAHSCFFFAPDTTPAHVTRELDSLMDTTFGKPVYQILELVARAMQSEDTDL